MALDLDWTTTIGAAKLPAGFTPPVVDELEDFAEESGTTTVARATVENATAATGWTALGNAVKDDVEDNIIPGLGLDIVANDITGRIVITKVEHAFSTIETDDLPNIAKTAVAQIKANWRFQWVSVEAAP